MPADDQRRYPAFLPWHKERAFSICKEMTCQEIIWHRPIDLCYRAGQEAAVIRAQGSDRLERPLTSILTKKEEDIVRSIQGDIGFAKRPYQWIAQQTGIPEQEVLNGISGIRKIVAIVRHQKAGFIRNTMVVWAVPEDRCEAVGKILAAFPEVTHCYQRTPAFAEKYNLFSMIHLRSQQEEDRLLRKISAKTGLTDYLILTSEEEFKKSSMAYY
jgi:DNA-binding Lrp family transcriptional regulator